MPPRPFEGIIAIEGELTGDGRLIEPDALYWEDLPIPLRWQEASSWGGHEGSVVVGQIETIWRDGREIRATGTFHDESDDDTARRAALRAIELAEDGVVGVSIGMDDDSVEYRMDKTLLDQREAEFEAWWNGDEVEREEVDGQVILDRFDVRDTTWAFTRARIREATIVDTGALATAAILPADQVAVTASFGIAASLSADTRARAFTNPNFGPNGDVDPRLVWQEPTRPEEGSGGWGAPFTIEDDGSFYAHATLRFRCHGSMRSCWRDHGHDLSQWLIGDATGTGIPTGVLTFDTTHGVEDSGKTKSRDWLANTGLGWGDATAGYDQHGLWVAGRLRSGLTERDLNVLRASTLSGEWHPNGAGRLRLVGILSVNSPGLLVQRVPQDYGIAASFTIGARCCPSETKTVDEQLASIQKTLGYLLRQGVD